MRKKTLSGIYVFSILIVVVSLWDLQGFTSFERYRAFFYPLAGKTLVARYIVSIGLRLLLLIAAVGILFHKDIFRRIILFISFFTIATVYWKHPVSCF